MIVTAVKLDGDAVEVTLFDGNVDKVVRTEFLPGAFENMEVFKTSPIFDSDCGIIASIGFKKHDSVRTTYVLGVHYTEKDGVTFTYNSMYSLMCELNTYGSKGTFEKHSINTQNGVKEELFIYVPNKLKASFRYFLVYLDSWRRNSL